MDLLKLIAELRAERARIDEALVSLEKLALTQRPRRGRPPAWTRTLGDSKDSMSLSDSKKAPAHMTAITN